MEQQTTIEISTSSILKLIFIIFGLIFIYFIRDIVLMVLAALIFAIALDRPIDLLQDRKVPRFLAAIFIYLVLFSVVGLLFYLVIPALAVQIKSFVLNYSLYLEGLGRLQSPPGFINLKDLFSQLAEELTRSAETLAGTLISVFGGLISFLTIIVVAVFLNIQENGVKKFIFYLTPVEHQPYVLSLFDKIQHKVGNWLWGKIICAAIIGLLTFAGLYLMGIKYAVLLGFLAALLNFIPFVGAIIAAIPAVLLALAESPILAISVVALYTVINGILEGLVLTPLLMKKAVDLNPALIILVLLVGARLAGVLGVILAIPSAAIVSVFVDDYIQKKRRESGAEVIQKLQSGQ